MNGYSCVSNDVCMQNLGWAWMVTVIGYIIYSLYIVMTSFRFGEGLTMCVLYYGQLATFASIPTYVGDQALHSATSSWFAQITQFVSVLSIYEDTCYGPNMGAYAATVAQLSGPAIVLVVSLLLTAAAKKLMQMQRFTDFLQKRKLDIRISLGATVTNVLLLLFSSVTNVVFRLITCQDIGHDLVVYIDGTVQCAGPQYGGLIAVAAMLCAVPLLFWAGLKFNKIPVKARAVACSAYTDSRYYWGAITLLFRLVTTILQATVREFPSVSAMALSFCTVLMLILLMKLRPYVHQRTYHMDVFCYACLMVQYILEVLVRTSQSLGISVGTSNNFFQIVLYADAASAAVRCVIYISSHSSSGELLTVLAQVLALCSLRCFDYV